MLRLCSEKLMFAFHGSHPPGSLRLAHLASCGMVTFLSGEACLALLLQRVVHFSSENAGRAYRLIKSGHCQDQLPPGSEEDTTKQREANRRNDRRINAKSAFWGNLCGEGDSRRRPAGYCGPRKSAACQGIARRAKSEGHIRRRTPS